MKKFCADGHELTATPSMTKKIIKEINLPIKKSWGQNFLVEPSVAKKIVAAADIEPSDHVFEVGPGIGGMSQLLAQEAACLTLVEIDPLLYKFLTYYFSDADHVEVLNQDALTLDFKGHSAAKGFNKYKLVANLPYYITTPLLMYFLEKGGDWQTLVLMMQKEVVNRIMAAPANKDYGALSLAVQYRAKVEKIIDVSPVSFIPRPEVDSSVIRLKRWQKPPVDVKDEALLFAIIASAFAQRRKTLANSLANGTCVGDKEFWYSCFELTAIDGGRRGETLSLAEFALLANTACQIINTKKHL
ncbi:MAG: 16S rRNA (adenine(1518)-N(6)/adenine(1519)-N(6))-dimethyltransferase RsmA [Bacillota bacterium]|jgi:16S rRNA (adenine1518-N6/adenine1519-N6)-dimethyltransferase